VYSEFEHQLLIMRVRIKCQATVFATNSPTMSSYPYTCDLEISFPTASHAEIVKKTLEVDREIGDRAVKTFSLMPGANTTDQVVLLV
jgi:hypothetical protein